ncbi:MAG TPA: copper ion binding protein [Solirubrobacterales bacterium]|nr:copper ion binding protein [Solirubrobacterales bacterium]
MTLTLQVPDMSCGHCVQAVSDAVGKVAGVSDVKVDLDAKRVEVEGEGVEAAQVTEAIREAGYEPEQA